MSNISKLTSFANSLFRIVKGHTGEVLCDTVVKCLKEFGIEKKVSGTLFYLFRAQIFRQVLGIVCDNTSNNDTMMAAIEKEIGGQLGV